MAMMITRFHKLIQSKTVWAVILGIIVIAFVGFFTPTMRGSGQKQQANDVGKLFGKKISQKDFLSAYRNAYFWQVFSAGRMLDVTPEMAEALRREAWLRLAVLKKAADENIIVTDQEVIQQMQMIPVFRNEAGAFDNDRYRGILQSLDMSPQMAEHIVREQITIYKLMYRTVQASLVSPYELEQAYHIYTDRLVLDYAVLSSDDVSKSVSVSREDAETLYNENPEIFRMPAKVRVSYIEFPVADFLGDVEIPEGTAMDVYNNNIENYRIESTGDVAFAEYTPFEEVEEEINGQIRDVMARRKASEAAYELVSQIAPKSEGELPDFAGQAQAAGLEIKTLPAFAPGDELAGIDSTAPFRQAAFGLQEEGDYSFSDPIVGKDSVYVLSLEQRYESFIPPFESVEADAMKSAKAKAAAQALTDRSREIQAAVELAVDGGASFSAAVKPFGLDAVETGEFDLTAPLDDPYVDVLVQISLSEPQGAVCTPVPVEGGMLIAYVARRTATDSAIGLPAVRQDLVQGIARSHGQRLVADWQTALMKEAELEEFPQ